MSDYAPPTEGVTTPPADSPTGVHQYGFRWGPMNVTRLCMGRKGDRINYLLGVRTKHHDVEVSVSGKGRTVRVWIDGKEATT